MSKLFLGVSVPAFGGFLSGGGAQAGGVTQAALRAGDTSVMSLTDSMPKPSCGSCALSDVPRFVDITISNLQSVPSKTHFDGRMLRR